MYDIEEYEASLAAAYLANHGDQGPTGMKMGMFERYFLMRDTQQSTLKRNIRNNKPPLVETEVVSIMKQSILAELDLLARTAAVRGAAYAWAREELGRAEAIYQRIINEIE